MTANFIRLWQSLGAICQTAPISSVFTNASIRPDFFNLTLFTQLSIFMNPEKLQIFAQDHKLTNQGLNQEPR